MTTPGVTLAFRAMTGGFPAAGMTDTERPGEQIFRELELADEGEFPLAELGCLRAFGLRVHLGVIILQVKAQNQQNLRTRK